MSRSHIPPAQSVIADLDDDEDDSADHYSITNVNGDVLVEFARGDRLRVGYYNTIAKEIRLFRGVVVYIGDWIELDTGWTFDTSGDVRKDGRRRGTMHPLWAGFHPDITVLSPTG